jgi:hypothetical protein
MSSWHYRAIEEHRYRHLTFRASASSSGLSIRNAMRKLVFPFIVQALASLSVFMHLQIAKVMPLELVLSTRRDG